MESRRLSIIRSHLLPTSPIASPSSQFTPSNCSSCDDKTTQHCVFCSIVRGDSPALKLYEDDLCLCILDRNPLSHGHSLIIPKTHFSCLESTPPSLIAAMCSKAPFIANALMKASGSDSFNLLVNNGAAAGQVIYHTHIHIIPRKTNDCLWTTESLPRYPLIFDQEASHLVSSVREQLMNVFDNYKGGQESGLPRCAL
ncbi:Adenylylsulfatase HINT3 [Linum grandiflorum]